MDQTAQPAAAATVNAT